MGVQPSFTQHPPTWVRSIKAVLWPALANAPARGVPAWPDPIMMASNFTVPIVLICIWQLGKIENEVLIGKMHVRCEDTEMTNFGLRSGFRENWGRRRSM